MTANGDVCAAEGPKDLKEREKLCLLRKWTCWSVWLGNENCCSQMPLWCKQFDHSFYQ